ncbi:hypothetical protein Pelo_5895 [Pelomyxa schiedti]|nr:hypothetical protein Pelo_5895 [Pelomyxa schiedti]
MPQCMAKKLLLDFLPLWLPTTLADIGLPPLTNEQLQAVANKTCLKTSSSQESIWNEPYTVNPQVVIDCIKRADAHGRARKSTTNSF